MGVGIDYNSFLWRYWRSGGVESKRRGDPHADDGGAGIVFNALSVVAGFAVLLLSNFLPVMFFGFLEVVSISACLIGAGLAACVGVGRAPCVSGA